MLSDADSALGRVRTLMDAWVGLWFWPLDTGVAPPTWAEWIEVAEVLLRPDAALADTGQLDLFEDLKALEDAEHALWAGQATVTELRERYPWLDVALGAARAEGAFHWELEFAPVFQQGGFDLQVGNPPWTKLYRTDTALLIDAIPRYGFTTPPQDDDLVDVLRTVSTSTLEDYLRETASSEGNRELLSSPHRFPFSSELGLNLYFVFIEQCWRTASGITGLLHQLSHMTDSRAGLRRESFRRLRLFAHYQNQLKLFEDIGNAKQYCVGIYGRRFESPEFRLLSWMLHPDTMNGSLAGASGPAIGLKTRSGSWDLRPHADRVVSVSEPLLGAWADLFAPPGTPAIEAPLILSVTATTNEALGTLSTSTRRIGDEDVHWSSGLHERGAQRSGLLVKATEVPGHIDDMILQGGHIWLGDAVGGEPNEKCRSHRDWSSRDLDSRATFLRRTNFQSRVSVDELRAAGRAWAGVFAPSVFRHVLRRMCDSGMERTLIGAVIPPGQTTSTHASR